MLWRPLKWHLKEISTAWANELMFSRIIWSIKTKILEGAIPQIWVWVLYWVCLKTAANHFVYSLWLNLNHWLLGFSPITEFRSLKSNKKLNFYFYLSLQSTRQAIGLFRQWNKTWAWFRSCPEPKQLSYLWCPREQRKKSHPIAEQFSAKI